ncbi:type II toxin-antitoxin system RelE/ParE family toxin [candidate division KSB1 bacterium]|nr:type II toxin-antitoxin system RelE/ParE family toxin [candidate division KSB1 bacterium]NIR72647.1 type II toxin-antitoxin system RelE/ParE family toxin [candidate division KSB1 bacterium]NIS23677.1 type II toxin-antitoxin system RelE/ParE family toxin [candidate division KSB1 bacterium]NIT70597.1 type II toxin-antitoxin system RelE/ParE family toxin [candidate division KSB1 bacterium]NIU24325.1 type II toxin-antitoxin system RelE/ParE family toxin [candidate division KSB1 bacterium]
MAKINWTAEAEKWLQEIYDYIAADNPNAAARTVDAIYDKAQILLKFPKIGYRYEQIPEREVRILLYGHYRISYLIKPNRDIDILGVFHGALDITRYLFNDT